MCICSDAEYAQFPPLKVQIDNYVYTLNKENYVDRSGRTCYFKLMSLDFPPDYRFWVMGITFFHNYYTVFDSDNKRMGFAVSKLSTGISENIPTVSQAFQAEQSSFLSKATILSAGQTAVLNSEAVSEPAAQDNQSMYLSTMAAVLIFMFVVLVLYLVVASYFIKTGMFSGNDCSTRHCADDSFHLMEEIRTPVGSIKKPRVFEHFQRGKTSNLFEDGWDQTKPYKPRRSSARLSHDTLE